MHYFEISYQFESIMRTRRKEFNFDVKASLIIHHYYYHLYNLLFTLSAIAPQYYSVRYTSARQACGQKKLHVYHLAFTLHSSSYTSPAPRSPSRSVSLHIRMPSACLLLCDYIQQPLGCKLPKPTHIFWERF